MTNIFEDYEQRLSIYQRSISELEQEIQKLTQINQIQTEQLKQCTCKQEKQY